MINQKPPTFPDLLDVIIIGAGPCGLAVAARLQEETPSAMFTDEEHQRYHWINKHSGRMALVRAHNKRIRGVKAEKWHGGNGSGNTRSKDTSTHTRSSSSPSSSISTLVLDSSGNRWMERWNRLFRILEIEHLRSPMFFHVDPGDRDGMLAYTRETGREELGKDLWEIPGCVGKELSKHKQRKKQKQRQARRGFKSAEAVKEVQIDERDRKDYFSPSAKLFADFCSAIASRYSLDHGNNRDDNDNRIFTITTNGGIRFYARAVVLAIGPGSGPASANPKNFPWELSSEEKMGACHAMEIKLIPSKTVQDKIRRHEGTNVVVVGGGLTSAQIADIAVRRGVRKVWFLLRSGIKVKHFDIDLTWMGKFKNYEKAAFWSADTDEERLEMIKVARNGGSITPTYHKILKQHVHDGRLSIHTHTTITDHKYCPETQTWQLTTNPPIPDLPPIDYIYFATGVKTDVTELPLLRRMQDEYPIETKEGLPCLTDDLMWRSDVPLFLTGRLAALRLGPGAPNLEGARLGAERVAWGLEEVLGGSRDADHDDDSRILKSRECFCGLGNRYAGLSES